MAQEGKGDCWEIAGRLLRTFVHLEWGAGTRASLPPVIFICMKICGKWIPDLALQGVHAVPQLLPSPPPSFQCTLHPGPNLAMQHVWLWLM